MKKILAIALGAVLGAQTAHACFVYFTNDLNRVVTVTDVKDPNVVLKLRPGVANVQWPASDAHTMADFKIKDMRFKQSSCTPDKKVYFLTSTLDQGIPLEQVTQSTEYFEVNPPENEPDAPCGCSGEAQ